MGFVYIARALIQYTTNNELSLFYKFHLVFPSDEEEINDFEEAEGIDQEDGDKPTLLAEGGGAPEGKAFPHQHPYNEEGNEYRMYAQVAGEDSDRFHDANYSEFDRMSRIGYVTFVSYN